MCFQRSKTERGANAGLHKHFEDRGLRGSESGWSSRVVVVTDSIAKADIEKMVTRQDNRRIKIII